MRFACQPGCTKCCEQQGFVYLTEGDILRLAAFLKITALAFERRYVYRTKNIQIGRASCRERVCLAV